jgi:hypothetical protein
MISGRHEVPPSTPDSQPSDIHWMRNKFRKVISSEPEDIGDFGKCKKKKGKARRTFYGI